jgi:hypothetical protein
MFKRTLSVLFLLSSISAGSAFAQECLHGTGETPEQTARRRAALAATRTVNNIQFNRPGSRDSIFLTHADLATAPSAKGMGPSTNGISLNPDTDIVPGWKLTLDVTSNGYWFMVKDTTDPCQFAYVSNQLGVIFTAEPIR